MFLCFYQLFLYIFTNYFWSIILFYQLFLNRSIFYPLFLKHSIFLPFFPGPRSIFFKWIWVINILVSLKSEKIGSAYWEIKYFIRHKLGDFFLPITHEPEYFVGGEQYILFRSLEASLAENFNKIVVTDLKKKFVIVFYPMTTTHKILVIK